MTDFKWKWVIRAALLWYFIWGILYIRANPGFQYDEAIDVLGSVQLLHSHEELKLPHAPDTWFCVAQHCFPLMSARYIGSIKDYLCLALFSIFGPHAQVERLMALTLGAIGIFGLVTLLAKQISSPVAAAAAWVLALNPSYLDMTALDNSGFTPMTGAFGLLCLAASAYLQKQNPRTAFWVGAAIGLGIWARANYIWVIGALSAALLLSAGKRLLVPLSHWAAFAIGGIAGGLPFLAYQALSGGGTWEAVGMFPVSLTLPQRLRHCVWMLSETLLSNGEHHRVWAGPESLPAWQLWLFPTLVAAASVIAIAFKQRRGFLPRVAALTFLIFIGTFFFASLPIGEHHLVILIPIAAVVVVLASSELIHRYRRSAAVIALFAAIYAASGIYWQSATLTGLRTTGGVGVWSNAVYGLTQRLRTDYPGREIKVLDWGLQNSIFVLSNAQVRTRELFWDSTIDQSDGNVPWIEEIRRGGVFLLNGPQNRQIPAASTGFLRALAEGRPTMHLSTIPQQDGITYAEIVDITPNTLGTGPAPPPDPAVPSAQQIGAADPEFLKHATGFYILEKGGWRWTMKDFSIQFPASLPPTTLTLQVNVPELVVQKLGPVTLTLRTGTHLLAPETLSRPGDYTITRTLDPTWPPDRFDFHLDKTLPPTATDIRNLGIIFVTAALNAK